MTKVVKLLTPEQVRYTFASFVPGVVDLIDARLDKPLRGKEAENPIVRTEKVARASGWKTFTKHSEHLANAYSKPGK